MSEIVKSPVLTPENQADVLKYLGLDPKDTATQALVQICNRYGFDPLLKHVVLIGQGGGKKNTYVTRDGLLHLAHQSTHLDGISVLEEGDSTEEWWAIVEVYRKDMSHPFRYRGRYAKTGQNKKFGPEMAVKCAEVMALRRAFDVSLPTVEEQWDQVAPRVMESIPEPPLPPSRAVVESLEDPGIVEETVPPPAPQEHVKVIKVENQDRLHLKNRMNHPEVDGKLRSSFREKFGDPNKLTGSLLREANVWVEEQTKDLEPF